jgi:glycosyltransferase involved in cell wall biosynthesis
LSKTNLALGVPKQMMNVAAQHSAQRKLRVLIVAPSLDILGGQAVQAQRLLQRLREDASLEVGFLPINPRLPGALRKLQAIKYVRTIVTSVAYCMSLLARVPRYDVIHVFSASYFSFVLAPTPAILAGKLYGRKVLLNYHSGEAGDHLQRWRGTAIPTIRLADSVVVPSDYLVRVFADFELPAQAILNLIETDRFEFRKRDPLRPVFLSNRNFESHYGVDRVLRAFGIIQKRFPEARLTVAGDGPLRTELEDLSRDLNLKNVEFTGRVAHERILELYNAADIFLNGSEIDNQPLSILEAYACGLPVVTTDAGGIPDIVTHEETGLMSPCGDVEGLAANAMRLLQDNDLAQRLARKGREECRKYTWEAVHHQWLACYHELGKQAAGANKAKLERA